MFHRADYNRTYVPSGRFTPGARRPVRDDMTGSVCPPILYHIRRERHAGKAPYFEMLPIYPELCTIMIHAATGRRGSGNSATSRPVGRLIIEALIRLWPGCFHDHGSKWALFAQNDP